MKPLPLLAALASLVACISPIRAQQHVTAAEDSGAAPTFEKAWKPKAAKGGA
jgi:hypothetical protein